MMETILIEAETIRHYHQQREAKRRAQQEAERLTWLARTQDVIGQIAPAHPGIKSVYLFGSLVQAGRFRTDSDIDVAVESKSVEAESAFWRALEQALQRDVDVRPLVGAISEAVARYGEWVYERKNDYSQ